MRIFPLYVFPCLLVFPRLLGSPHTNPSWSTARTGRTTTFPLGVLEAAGRLKDGEKEILVMDVGKGGAAQKAGLMAGDRVMMIEGKTPDAFSKKTDTGLDGPQALLGTVWIANRLLQTGSFSSRTKGIRTTESVR